MAKYDITYSCGHSGTVNLYSFRENRLAYLEQGECFECYKKRSNEKLHQEAEQLELPPLVGTEKQVSWAETLRIQKFAVIEEDVEHLDHESKAYHLALMALEKISNETSAKKWIEWRFDLSSYILGEVIQEMKNAPTEEQKRAEIEERERAEAIQRQALNEATLRPEQAVSEIAAEIQVHGNVVSVLFPELRNDFNGLVKSFGYHWYKGQWKRAIDKFAGNPADRSVELGCVLLAHGFLVRVFDDDIRARIVASEFESEQTRWIVKRVAGQYIGWFAIKWGSNEDYYHVARNLPNSRYSSPNVVVLPAQFEQVLDFAQKYDFRLSDGAKEVARQAKDDKEKMLVVSKSPVKQKEKIVASVKPPVLEVPDQVEIDDALKDD